MRPPLRSIPPSSPSPYRYLGRGGGERPVRVQIILALVAALVLVAVPLYLWRRPRPADIQSADAAQSAQATPTPMVLASSTPIAGGAGAMADNAQGPQATAKAAGLEIAPIKTLKCQDPGPGKTPPERCDGIRFFEDGLTRAIQDGALCAPSSKNGYVASFVLEFHFGKKRMNLFYGKSTTLPRSKRRELLRCIERAMPTPDWDRIPHQHAKYTINALVTYAPSTAPAADAPGAPTPSSPSKAAPKKKTKG